MGSTFHMLSPGHSGLLTTTVPTGNWGGWVLQWCWINFPFLGILLIWITVGQGLTVLAVGVGGLFGYIFFLLTIISLFFLPLSARRPDID